MKPLTPEFIKQHGFELGNTTHEDDFYYEDYTSSDLYREIVIFFNYFKNGEITYDVEAFGGYNFRNVGEDELLTLIKIFPK